MKLDLNASGMMWASKCDSDRPVLLVSGTGQHDGVWYRMPASARASSIAS
jgi:hypothetical protein